MKFIRKNGRIIPISRIAKGAAKDAVTAGVGSALLTHVALKAPASASLRAGLAYGAAWGALSGVVRTGSALNRARKKRAGS